jgi:FKBP-type peptidyl-prolyl cis-trans isomerase SlyD
VRILTSIIVTALICHLSPAWAADEGAPAEIEASETASEESAAAPKPTSLVIEAGLRVSIEYKLTTDDGTFLDDNDGDLMVFDHGDSPLLPAVEEGLLGLSRGDSKRITLEAEDGFGLYDESLVSAVPADMVPKFTRVAGTKINWEFPSGRKQSVTVVEVKEDEVVIDFNHPLAGERLHFDIEVVAVREIPE